ncbi:MAG: S-adenosylmethionine:tRNA ribosyltransferase-isomerase [Cyclobacteriaceae bacterium]
MLIQNPPRLSDFQYGLPENYIAKFPLENRDASKLLHYEEGKITHHRFFELPQLLPEDSLLVFNDTKVIPARLSFKKSTGAKIEIFLLKPLLPSILIQETMGSKSLVTWNCMIGNLKRWREGETLIGEIGVSGKFIELKATLSDKSKKEVTFSWMPDQVSFAELIEAIGEVPLPPYLNRKATIEDKPRYQTIYSKVEGAVAAPTAGLHFTEKTLQDLKNKKIHSEYLTLHVGAGTFQPIKEEDVVNHPMHSEQIVFSRKNIENLVKAEGNIVSVGTTSMRSLESLYWYGVKLIKKQGKSFEIDKLIPYQIEGDIPSTNESLRAILHHMDNNHLEEIIGHTEIFIFPGYEFKVCQGLITNFHQPGSTLILLVAAFTKGNWRTIYQEAIAHNYRFLSYGDSSLLWFKKKHSL